MSNTEKVFTLTGLDGTTTTLSTLRSGNHGRYTREALNGKKPVISLPFVSGNVFSNICRAMDQPPEPADLLSAMIYACKTFVFTPSSTWTSFGLKIAESGHECNPLMIFDVQWDESTKDTTGNTSAIPNEEALVWLGLYLTSIRIQECKSWGRDTQINKAAEHFKVLVKGDVTLDKIKRTLECGKYGYERRLIRLMAAWDMFSRWSGSVDPYMTYATVNTRLKDSRSLDELLYGEKLFCRPITEYIKLVNSKRVLDDMNRLIRPNEEIQRENSYNNYAVSLGIVNKSPYSTNANPYFHSWINSIGFLMGENRSRNARVFSVSAMSLVFRSSICAFIHLKKLGGANKTEWQSMVQAFPERMSDLQTETDDEETSIAEFGRYPQDYSIESLSVLSSTRFAWPLPIVQMVDEAVLSHLQELRENSVAVCFINLWNQECSNASA